MMSFWKNKSPPAKYHGLLNQGATCYLNSVLQVLFMTEDFRAAVERDTSENPDHDCIDRHLTSLFADLKEREAYTYKITQKLGITRVYEQQDAAEYFEKILRLTRSGASEIFCGWLTHKTICAGCSTEAESHAAFWHLPLALVDSNSDYSVVDGIKDYFRSSEFSGDNQMYCDHCDDKSDATIKCVIKRHPEVLMLLLKRFEFNYSYMSYVKINRTVEVPFTLQIPENQTYELYAVVDHFGDLRGGHYTATIKDDEGWYTFNDTTVTLNEYQPFQVDNFERSSSAYLLFYRKMNVPAADAEDNMETSTPEVTLPATIYDQCQEGGVRMRMREEAEEEGNVPMVTMKDIVGSTEVGIPPDLCNTEKNPDTKSYNHHGSNEETNYDQDVNAKKQRGEEDVGENAQADEQTEKGETQLVESVEVQDSDSGKQRTSEAEVSDRHKVHDRDKQDEMTDTKRRVMDTSGKTEDDKQPKRMRKSLTKYPDRDLGYQDNRDNEDNAREDLGGTQEVDDIKPVSVQMEGKTGEGERSSEGEKLFEFQGNRRKGDSEENMPEDEVSDRHEVHDRNKQDEMSDAKRRVMDTGGKTEDDKQPWRVGKSLTKYPDRDLGYRDNEDNAREDLGGAQEVGQVDDVKLVSVQMEGECERSSEGEKLFEFQDKRKEGDSEENIPEDDQTCKQGSSTMYNIHEQQRQDKICVKEHKGKHDKHGQDVEDQDNEDNIRQKQPEQKISVVVVVRRQTEEKGNTEDELIRDKADSSRRRARSAGSRRLTEIQQVGDDETTRQHAPPQVRPACSEDGGIDKRRGSKKSQQCEVRIIEEEIKETPSGTQTSTVTEYIQIGTVKNSSQERKEEGNETISKKKKVSDTQEPAAGMEDTKIKRGSHEKKSEIISVVGVKRQTEEKGNTEDELIRDKADSSRRRARSAGSRRLTENQQVGDDETTRQHAPPQVRPACNEDGDIDKRRGSKKSQQCEVKIIEEEIKETPSGTQTSIVTEHIQIETVKNSSQQSSLSKLFDNLKLTKPSMPNKLKRRSAKVQEGDETISTTHSSYGKKKKVSDTKIKKGEKKEKKRRQDNSEKKKKHPTGCFACHLSHTSESD